MFDDYEGYLSVGQEDPGLSYDVLVASSSDAPPTDPSLPVSGGFQVFLAMALGVIAGLLLVGSRRF